MLPRSTHTRTSRERNASSGRTAEIQRLIGRSLRSVARLDLLGERTFTVDCDVIRADGGTRTAAITGAYVALMQAFHKLVESKKYTTYPIRCGVAAVSCGLVDDTALLDLDYSEDYRAAVDFNVVMTEAGEMVEVQGTGESRPFTRDEMTGLIDLADGGIRELFGAQKAALKEAGVTVSPATPTAS